MPLLSATHCRGDLNLRRQPLNDSAAISVSQHGFVCRRHLAIAEHRDDFKPPVHIASVQQIGIQSVDAEIALLRLRSVTLHAGLLQNRLNVRSKCDKLRLRRFGPDWTPLLCSIAGLKCSCGFQLFERQRDRVATADSRRLRH